MNVEALTPLKGLPAVELAISGMNSDDTLSKGDEIVDGVKVCSRLPANGLSERVC